MDLKDNKNKRILRGKDGARLGVQSSKGNLKEGTCSQKS